MKKKINGEQVFTCVSGKLAIAQTSSGYTLAYSTDGENFTEYKDETPANEDMFVEGCVVGTYYKLVGNEDDNVLVIC